MLMSSTTRAFVTQNLTWREIPNPNPNPRIARSLASAPPRGARSGDSGGWGTVLERAQGTPGSAPRPPPRNTKVTSADFLELLDAIGPKGE